MQTVIFCDPDPLLYSWCSQIARVILSSYPCKNFFFFSFEERVLTVTNGSRQECRAEKEV